MKDKIDVAYRNHPAVKMLVVAFYRYIIEESVRALFHIMRNKVCAVFILQQAQHRLFVN